MNVIELLVKEYDQEAAITRKMMERVPEGKWDWKPHPKSMSLKALTTHLAEIPGWPDQILHNSELNFEDNMNQPPVKIETTADLLAALDKSITMGRAAIAEATEDDLLPTWTLRMGDHEIMKLTKYEAVRHAFSQQTHHRAQLGLFLRLLDVAIPGSYGPSADEQM